MPTKLLSPGLPYTPNSRLSSSVLGPTNAIGGLSMAHSTPGDAIIGPRAAAHRLPGENEHVPSTPINAPPGTGAAGADVFWTPAGRISGPATPSVPRTGRDGPSVAFSALSGDADSDTGTSDIDARARAAPGGQAAAARHGDAPTSARTPAPSGDFGAAPDRDSGEGMKVMSEWTPECDVGVDAPLPVLDTSVTDVWTDMGATERPSARAEGRGHPRESTFSVRAVELQHRGRREEGSPRRVQIRGPRAPATSVFALKGPAASGSARISVSAPASPERPRPKARPPSVEGPARGDDGSLRAPRTATVPAAKPAGSGSGVSSEQGATHAARGHSRARNAPTQRDRSAPSLPPAGPGPNAAQRSRPQSAPASPSRRSAGSVAAVPARRAAAGTRERRPSTEGGSRDRGGGSSALSASSSTASVSLFADEAGGGRSDVSEAVLSGTVSRGATLGQRRLKARSVALERALKRPETEGMLDGDGREHSGDGTSRASRGEATNRVDENDAPGARVSLEGTARGAGPGGPGVRGVGASQGADGVPYGWSSSGNEGGDRVSMKAGEWRGVITSARAFDRMDYGGCSSGSSSLAGLVRLLSFDAMRSSARWADLDRLV